MFFNKPTWPIFLVALFMVSPTWAQDEVPSTDESAAGEEVNETVNADATVNETQETSETTEEAEAAESAEGAEGAEGAEAPAAE